MKTYSPWTADCSVAPDGFLDLHNCGSYALRMARDAKLDTITIEVNCPDPGFDYLAEIMLNGENRAGNVLTRGSDQSVGLTVLYVSKGDLLSVRLKRLMDTPEQLCGESPFVRIKVELELLDVVSQRGVLVGLGLGWDDDPFEMGRAQ